MKMSNILYCQYCCWKKNVKDASEINLKEVNSTDKKKRYRCPSCGRPITLRNSLDLQKEVDAKLKKEKHEKEMKDWIQENINFFQNSNKET